MQIEIGNSYSQVTGATPEQLRDLRKRMSYRVTGAEAYYARANPIRYLMTPKGVFPTGLLHLLDDLAIPRNDIRRIPRATSKLFTLGKHPTPYPEQLEAVEAAVSATNGGRGVLSLCTAFGKTLTMALLVNRLQLKTLIVVPNLTLKHQLTETFRGYFGSLKNITIENIDSPALAKASGYDVLIVDESHHVAAHTYHKLNKMAWAGIYHRYFFTATPYRNKPEEMMLFEALAGRVIYELGYLQARDLGYVASIEAYYVDLPKRPVEGYSWAAVYSELVVRNEARNQVILDLLTRLRGACTLCLVREVAHGKWFEDRGYTFVKGENDDNEHTIACFNNTEIGQLVATTGVFGEGVDSRPCEYVIIAGLGKAKGSFMQAVGRAVRKYPGKESAKVIIFRDASQKWPLAHFRAQVKILKEDYGVTPIKLDL